MNFLKILLLASFAHGVIGQGATKFISTSPAITELLFQIGLGNQIVGTSQFSDFPPEAKDIARIGTLFYPNIEKTLQIKPDAVLIDYYTLNNSYVQGLQALHFKTKIIQIDSIPSLLKVVHELLQEFPGGNAEKMPDLLRRIGVLKKQAKPFRFIVTTWSNPVIAASQSTFLSSLFELVGGQNSIPKGIKAPYIPVSKEWLLRNPPDFVFFLHPEDQNVLKQLSENFKQSPPKIIPLSSDYFARSNFSGIYGMEDVLRKLWN